MFKNKAADGQNNLCGRNIARLRIDLKLTQSNLADRMKQHGMKMEKNTIQRIESGKRVVTDIEIIAFAKALDTTFEELVGIDVEAYLPDADKVQS